MSDKQLPEGWRIVKFGDMAKHISKRVEPKETNLNIYVGLEHLDPDSLRIKRHGVPSDVEGQKLLVKKGQIIFGKRRAYQRKLGVADWDCICSAHAMVLEANPETVIPEFLPFFMQSDVFMSRAVAISEGSLSPTIKWKVLAIQEFIIPSIEKQKAIVTFMSKVIDATSGIENTKNSIKALKLALNKKYFSNQNGLSIGDIALVKTGATPRRDIAEYWNGNIPWMSSGEVHKKRLFKTDECITEDGLKKSNTTILPKQSVVLAMNGQGKTRGTVAITEIETTCNQSIAAIIPDEQKMLPTFLFFYLESKYSEIRGLTGEGRNGLNLKHVRNIPVPTYSITDQQKIAHFFQSLFEIEDQLNKKMDLIVRFGRKYLTSQY